MSACLAPVAAPGGPEVSKSSLGLAGLVDERFCCPVCSEVFSDPVQLEGSCTHNFCRDCITLWATRRGSSAPCPVCRADFTTASVSPATSLADELRRTVTVCSCGESVRLSTAREHSTTCQSVAGTIRATQAALEAGQRIIAGDAAAAEAQARAPPPGPNRLTFSCPICEMDEIDDPMSRNLDNEGLIEHCRNKHRGDRRRAVCPVCASMPWGDPTYASACFVEHLQLRHRFDYSTYADFGEADEDELLRRVMEESMRDAT